MERSHFCGTAPQKWVQCPKNVEQLLKCRTCAESISLYHSQNFDKLRFEIKICILVYYDVIHNLKWNTVPIEIACSLWLSSLFVVPVPQFWDCAPQFVQMFHFVSVFLDIAFDRHSKRNRCRFTFYFVIIFFRQWNYFIHQVTLHNDVLYILEWWNSW